MSPDPGGRPVKRLVLVLGMHRSGTSAVAGVLHKLGVALGDELLPPTPGNPKGYFEHLRVLEAHEALLEALHGGWMDPRSLPGGWLETAAARGARDVLAELVGELSADAPVAAVKDPRACRVVPLWLDVAARAGARPAALLVVRHPDEVAASLEKRGGMSRARAHLLWMIHLLEAERDSRGMPRAFVAYDALLADWRSELERLGNALPGFLPAPDQSAAAAIDAFLDASLRNTTDDGGSTAESPFRAMALELHALALRCTVEAPGDATDRGFDAFAERLRQRTAHSLEAPMPLDDASRKAADDPHADLSLQLARALHELWRPAMVQDLLRVCRLYYRGAGTAFAQERAVVAEAVQVEGGHQVEFELPAGIEVDFLRLDPDEAPGVFAIQSFSVDGRPLDDLAMRVVAANELRLPVSSHRSLVRFAALGDDPYVEFDARGLERREPAAPMRIVVRFRPETVLSEARDLLEDAALELQGGLRLLEERERRANREADRLQALAEAALASMASLSKRIDYERRGREEAAARLADALQAIRTQGDRLAADVADLGARQDGLAESFRRRSLGYWWRRMLGRRDDGQAPP